MLRILRFITPMTFSILEQVVEFAAEIGSDYSFAINLSPVSLRDRGSVDKIIGMMTRRGLSMTQFEFEVTARTGS